MDKRWLVGIAAAVGAVLVVVLVVLVIRPQSPSPHGPPSPPTPSPSTSPTSIGATVAVTCTNSTTADTSALQAAVKSAESDAGTVSIAPGTCALDDHLLATAPVTITGAAPTTTSLVQHAHIDIFGISGDNVTVENLHLDTATYNTTAPVSKNPNPPVLYSNGNNTTVRNVVAEAGSGFGLRITGPNPCYEHDRGGAVVSNVTMSNSGTGGFASIDIDCQSHAAISNITVHGGIVALYRDSNVSLEGEHYTPGPTGKACQPPWFITSDANGPSQNITIADVTSSGGRGVVRGSVPNLVIRNQTITNAACP